MTPAATRDPLAAGLSLRDLLLDDAGTRRPAGDAFSFVVDLDDAAPFVQSAGSADGWARMTDGRTAADGPDAVFRHDQAAAGLAPSWAGTLPKEEDVAGVTVVVNTDDRCITALRVAFDGRTDNAVTLALKPERDKPQAFVFAPRRCRRVALEPVAWTDGPRPVIGLDEVRLTVRRPVDFAARVVPLTSVGVLVRYPQAGVVLNQVRVNEPDAHAAQKRAVVVTLLRNLGADFGAASAK